MFYKIKSKPILIVLLKQIRFNSNSKSPTKFSNLHKLLIEMPRDRTYIAEAQKQRIRIKEKGVKYTPGTVNLQVLGSGAPGSPASVYLFTDQSRYLFNCGEGTQRLAHEHKTKLSRLEHIFVTRNSWDRFGGLPGLSLTVQDAGVPDLTLHGPQGLDEIFRAMKRFVVLKDLKVRSVNCESGGSYDDQVMTVFYVPIHKQSSNLVQENLSRDKNSSSPELELDETDYYAYENSSSSSNSSTPQPIDTKHDKREESVVICYICKLKAKPGSLNIEKCVDKGVPPGPLLGKLKNGFDVTLPDGTFVRADDVRSPTDPGPVFIFLDIPSEDYLKSFQEKSEVFKKYQAEGNNEENLAAVLIHFSPPEIIQKKSYQQFMESFSPSTKHLILNSTNKFSGYLAAHRIQWQLNQLDENIFPNLKENFDIEQLTNQYKKLKTSPEYENIEKLNEIKENVNGINAMIDHTNSLTCFHLRPRKGLDHDNEPMLNPIEYLDETHAIEGFTDSLIELKTELKKMSITKLHDEIRNNNFPKIIFLGTGSCIPNKTRNVSSILIHTNDSSCMLLDCGEGTWGQIIRFYGFEKAKEILKKLKIIYISHLHADHHIGLIGLLKVRQELGTNISPISLLAPRQMSSWLHFYNLRIESIRNEYNLIPLGELIENPLNTLQLEEMAIKSISTCLVRHCPYAFGVSIELDGFKINKNEIIKITYSGDTMPCDELIQLGMNSTILIHEATMEDELLNEAKYKMHSTISQALEQGNKMNSKYILLTHFSQRYAKLPRLENNPNNNVGIAFDNMEVTLNDLNRLHLMYPTLKLMFMEHCEEMEQKALKRALKNERQKQASSSIVEPIR